MKTIVLHPNEFRSTKWSGGQTTELYIYPDTGSYQERNFLFRLSTATVEVESSVFTTLPGVKRTLMVLSGEMTLIHEGQHRSELKEGDQDQFMGDWQTASLGMCTDLNLMTTDAASGTMRSYFGKMGEEIFIHLRKNSSFRALYIGDGTFKSNAKAEELHKGDLIIMEDQKETFVLTTRKNGMIVCIEVDYIR